MRIVNLLQRIEPFATKSVRLHGKLDAPDRVISSLQAYIQPLLSHQEDALKEVQEITPEFFFMPEIYSNINNQYLGINSHDTLIDQF